MGVQVDREWPAKQPAIQAMTSAGKGFGLGSHHAFGQFDAVLHT